VKCGRSSGRMAQSGRPDPASKSSFRTAARHEYALARLADVASLVAVYFRHPTHRAQD
jgi:hypothetical protein